MGLGRSVRKRLALARGEPAATWPGILFASDVKALERARARFFDAPWYADIHGLGDPDRAWTHYLASGRARNHAPFADLAGPDGKHLSQLGTEFLLRAGIGIGGGETAPLDPSDPDAADPLAIGNPEGKKVAVVTALFGTNEVLLPVDPGWAENADFYVFSDRKFLDRGLWQQLQPTYFNLEPRRRTAFFKTHLPGFFSSYERVLWLDETFLLCVDPARIVLDLPADAPDLALFRQAEGAGLVAEAAKAARLGRDDTASLLAQLRETSAHRAFRRPGLFSTEVLLMRPDSEALRRMCTHWWRYIMRGSACDQISLPLAIDDTDGLNWGVFPETRLDNSPFFARMPT